MTAASPDPLVIALAAVVGSMVGSFLNVVIIRLPEGRSIVRPGSACGRCGVPVRWYDNVPVLAWLWLRGRCRSCGVHLSVQYPLVEAGTGVLAVAAMLRFGPTADAVIAFAFLSALVAVSGVDLKIREIPDAISLPGTALALVLSPWSGLVSSPAAALVGALAGAGGLYLVAAMYEWIRDQEGMGQGDVKLLAMIGAVLGWEALVPTVLLASVVGAVIGIGLTVASGRKDLGLAIPFGPFLALGAAVCLLWPGWWLALLARLAG